MKKALRTGLILALLGATAACGSDSGGGDSAGAPADKAVVTVFSGVPPGGGIDLAVNSIIEAMDGVIDQRLRLDHVPGAGGLLAVDRLSSEFKDSNETLLVVSPTTLAATLTGGELKHGLTDLTPIGRLFAEYTYVFVDAKSDIKDMADLAAKLKAKPNSVKIGGAEVGGSDSITAGKLAKALGLDFSDLVYVGLGGAEGQQSLLGGSIDVWLGGPDTFDFVRGGDFRVLAGSSAERVEGLDLEIPTMVESGVDVVHANWRGVFAPPGISKEARAYWDEKFIEMSKTDTWISNAKEKGWDLITLDSAEFEAFLAEESKTLEEILTDLGLL